MTSASAASYVSSYPCRRRLPTTNSLSRTFIWQPTVSMYNFFVMGNRHPGPPRPTGAGKGSSIKAGSRGRLVGPLAAQTGQFRLELAVAFFGQAAGLGLGGCLLPGRLGLL